MKKVWLLLLLLLLLIFCCVWSKIDEIRTHTKNQTALVHTEKEVAPIKESIAFAISYSDKQSTLSGDLSNITQQKDLEYNLRTHSTLHTEVITKQTHRYDAGGVGLANKVLPHFLKHYKEGDITYGNDNLIITGVAKTPEAKETMEKLLQNSEISIKDSTTVDPDYYKSIAEAKAKAESLRLAKEVSQAAALAAKEKEAQALKNKQASILAEETRAKEEAKRLAKEKDEREASLLEAEKIAEELAKTNALEEARKIAQRKKDEEASLLATKKIQEKEKALEEERITKKEKQLLALQKRKEIKEAEALKEKNEAAAKEAARLKVARDAALLQKEKEDITRLLNMENIAFVTGKAKLSTKGYNTINELASTLKKYKKIDIEIAGHTDSDGSEKSNQILSQNRVNAVKKGLISQGISRTRLKAIGYGESHPLVPNTSVENKQKNRRVEIKILGE